ncbi:hypothetical protein M378DRAFT_644057 [Amanita muscaria Koide BX008]|uniref:Secreted protein n=1 Tax=Amanita muscaria (strain Koide BX008) TaxID=946122 RepID=A0A0C2X470_AMAMK|nr:hypothetical protein M378DRAFT_644057 [Amanita muscaria Koide BX008]
MIVFLIAVLVFILGNTSTRPDKVGKLFERFADRKRGGVLGIGILPAFKSSRSCLLVDGSCSREGRSTVGKGGGGTGTGLTTSVNVGDGSDVGSDSKHDDLRSVYMMGVNCEGAFRCVLGLNALFQCQPHEAPKTR